MSARAHHHAPSTIWPTRPIGTYPQTYLTTTPGGKISIDHFAVEGSAEGAAWFALSRHDARMLARRLIQCLEATK